ncbi:hypothetical protein PR202_gb11702 [Eleusine coracana subsp. coracana]|uniref:Uncharacterized protein n=1 Tax=Eleusine coracana subsp. coracana TaxID=191504 RepID=A0AAV5EKW6_ELECO|nr:hypothetical protein PR202_gb11702 [Eleusine coracana subsp. coracana]
MQVLFRATHWLRSWRLLQKEKHKDTISKVCQMMEIVTMGVFSKNGWSWRHRLG